MKRFIPILLIVVLSMILSGCQKDEVYYDMARFDRAYIPALVLTSKKDNTGQAVLAIKRLRQNWGVLTAKQAAIFAADARAEKIKDALEKADALISVGDYKGAHMELEEIREIMMKARRQHKIDYYPDYLTVFHSTMETIVSTVEGKSPEQLTKQDIMTISRYLPQAKTQWTAVSNAPFDAEVFKFTKETKEGLDALVQAEFKNLEHLEAAIKSGNHKLIIKHTIKIKQGYSGVYKTFGNFESVSLG